MFIFFFFFFFCCCCLNIYLLIENKCHYIIKKEVIFENSIIDMYNKYNKV